MRQAALIAGVSLLVMSFAAPVAEFLVYPKVVIQGNIEATVEKIQAHQSLFLAGVFCYLITFICDVVVAWAYHVLLSPANKSLSLLAAWFRLVHAVISVVGLLNLATVFRRLAAPESSTVLGTDRLHAEVRLLLDSFRYEWSFGLVFFGIHLGLVGCLVYRSGYIPRILGGLLAVAGLGFLLYCLGPYLYPGANLGFLMVTFLGETCFMLWLLARGRKIPEPAERG